MPVLAVYWPALDAPFIFDDIPAIVTNPSITSLWPPIGDAEHRGPLNPPGLAPTARRPLVNLSFAIDRHLHGLDPTGYRALNVVLHVFSAAVLAALVRRTLRLPRFAGAWQGVAWPLSLLVALLWALHPLNTESVVYVTQRTELLGGLCFLTILWAAGRYWAAASPTARRAWLAVATLASLAGVASKEIVVSAPLVVLLYERTFLVRRLREAWPSWPLYAGLALGWVLLALLNAGGVSGLSDARHHVPAHVWWMTQAKVVFLYLKLAVWPSPLSIHYAPRYLRTLEAAWPWLAAGAALAGATVALAWRRPATRPVVAGIVCVLAPTLLVPLPKMMVAERRMYLPLAGLVILAAVGGHRLASRRWPLAGGRLLAAVGAASIAAAVVGTAARLATYDTAVSIWEDAVRNQPDDAMSHYNLGVALLEAGRPHDALARFTETLRLDPEHTRSLDNLGMVLTRLGRAADALAPLERALRIDPADAVAHNNLGAALLELARPAEAIPHLERALTLEPDEPKSTVHRNLGRALLDTGRVPDAVEHLQRAVALDSADADAHFSLGVALMNAARAADAVGPLEEAVRLEPADAEARNALASAWLRTGRTDLAAAEFRRAIELAPGYADAHSNLGAALLDLGQLPDAIAHVERALALRPDHVNARYNLGKALLRAGRSREAAEQLREVIRLAPDDAPARFTAAVALAGTGESRDADATARAAGVLARSQGLDALAAEIDAWLASRDPGRSREAP